MAHDLTPREAELAAQFWADVGVKHIAGVYAEALLGAAGKAGQAEAVLAEFGSWLGDVLDVFPKLERILASGLVPHDQKNGILDHTLGSRASRLFLNFLKVLSSHGRLDTLRAIYRETQRLYERRQGRVRVQVATAAPLDGALALRIADSVRAMVGGEPVLEPVVDPKLIGGVVIRIGDTVYDGSVAAQLKRMRQKIIDRSAHEIQSRRDRFRYPAGD